jgi:hypothetical protein
LDNDRIINSMVSLNSYDILTDNEIQRSPSVYHFICFLSLLFVFFRSVSGLSSLLFVFFRSEVAFVLCFYLSAFLRSGSGLSSLLLSICSLSQGLLGSTIFFVRLWGWSVLLCVCLHSLIFQKASSRDLLRRLHAVDLLLFFTFYHGLFCRALYRPPKEKL